MDNNLKNWLGVVLLTVFCLFITGFLTPAYAADDDDNTNGQASEQTSGQNGTSGGASETDNGGSVTPEKLNVGEFLTAPGQSVTTNIGEYIVRFINFLALLVGSFAILAVIVGGFFMVIAGGREEMVTRGKDIIKFAIIGLIFSIVAYFVVALVQGLFY